MAVDPEDLDGIAAFFARRFTDPDERLALARASGLSPALAQGDPEPSWRAMVGQATKQGRLARLAQRAAERRFADENLRRLADDLRTLQPSRPSLGWLLLLPVGALLLWSYWPSPPDPRLLPPPAGAPEPVAQAPAQAAVDPAPPPAPTEPAPAAPAPVAPVAVEPAPVEPAPASPVPEPPSPSGATIPGRCGGTAGEPIGWWYAGESFTARKGETYTIRAGANVRDDYPRLENGWNARAHIRCSLVPGDRVKLSSDPFLIEGGSWWVQMRAGDLARG